MTEKPTATAGVEQDQAQGYLEYYWQKIGAPDDLVGIGAYDKRIMHDVPLQLQIEPLEVPKRPTSERDELVSYFNSNKWLPKSKWEANITALKGIDETLYRAGRTKQGKPEEALRSTYETIRGFWYDAAEDVKIFNSAMKYSNDFGGELNVDHLRSNHKVLYLLGDNLFFREMLDQAQWPRSNTHAYIDSQKYWRGFMLSAAESASDKVLGEAYDNFSELAKNRLRHWTEESQKLESIVGHLATKDVQVSRPGENSRQEQADQFDFEFQPPQDVQKQLEQRRREFEAEFDRLDHAGMPEGVKKQVLEQKFPEFMLPDREKLHKEEDRAARHNAAAGGGTHPTGPRGKKHIFDDNSASVESEYEGFGQ